MKEMILSVAGYLTGGHSTPLVAYTYKFPHIPPFPPLTHSHATHTHTNIPVGRALNEVTLCCCKDGCVRREVGRRGGGRGGGGEEGGGKEGEGEGERRGGGKWGGGRWGGGEEGEGEEEVKG